MPIYRDPKTGRWRFDFDRRIGRARQRLRKLLPAGWTRAQADAFDRAESARLYALASGVEKPTYTIDAAVACYLDERAPQLKHGRGLAGELRALLPWYTGRPIEQLADVCAEYSADQRGALAPATVRNRLSYLRAACRWGWRHHNMGDADPGARVAMPTVRNARQTYIDHAQVIQLARVCRHRGVRAVILIAFYSGMRVGEILAAKRVGGAFVLGDTKNGLPRTVPMHPKLSAAAKVAMPRRSEIDYYWPLARAACGLEHVTLHDIRHSAAAALINSGVDLYTVGGVLGHKSAASTKRYAHLSTETLRAAVGKIGRKVG